MNLSLVDDDGVLVLASVAGLRARYVRPKTFDYAFPKELVACMNGGIAFAWRSGGEGEHTLDVESLRTPPTSTKPKAILGRLIIQPDDKIMALPYSTFSFECDGARRFEPAARLGAAIAALAGEQVVEVIRRGKNTTNGYVFELRLWPEMRRFQPVEDVPGWKET